jgi:hypothetical protein
MDRWNYKAVPARDAKGNLTRVEFHVYEIANPDNSYLAYNITFSYDGNGRPVLIEGYDGAVLFIKATYQRDSNGNITLYEESRLDENTSQQVITGKCTSGNGTSISETFRSGEREKTVSKTDSSGNPAIRQYYTWTAEKWYMTHYDVFYPNDLVPPMKMSNNSSVGGTNEGGFDVTITVPADSIAGGSFVVKLPDGFTLDAGNTGLTVDFNDVLLEIIEQEDNAWLFKLMPKNTRSATLLSGEAVNTPVHVAYTVDGEVERGTYDITVHSIQFETPGGESIVEPAITVPATLNRWGVGNEVTEISPPSAWSRNGIIHVRSGHPQQVTIYSLSGAKLYEGAVPAGTTAPGAARIPKGVYIVTFDSGESLKVAVY